MLASLRRTPRITLAAVAALALGLAACGDDGADTGTDDAEVETPADDAGADADAGTDAGVEDPEAAAPAFEDLEEGEIVPGVYLDVAVDETVPVQAQPTPVGSAFVAALPEQTGAVSANVEFDGPSLEELLGGIDALVESGQAEIASGPEDIEIEGADEASRVELSAPEGEATATGLFAVADGNAISIAIEVSEASDLDVETVIDSLRIDPERLQMAGTLETPEGGTGTAPEDATDDGAAADDGESAADDGAAADDGESAADDGAAADDGESAADDG